MTPSVVDATAAMVKMTHSSVDGSTEGVRMTQSVVLYFQNVFHFEMLEDIGSEQAEHDDHRSNSQKKTNFEMNDKRSATYHKIVDLRPIVVDLLAPRGFSSRQTGMSNNSLNNQNNGNNKTTTSNGAPPSAAHLKADGPEPPSLQQASLGGTAQQPDAMPSAAPPEPPLLLYDSYSVMAQQPGATPFASPPKLPLLPQQPNKTGSEQFSVPYASYSDDTAQQPDENAPPVAETGGTHLQPCRWEVPCLLVLLIGLLALLFSFQRCRKMLSRT